MNTPYCYVINDLQHIIDAIEAREADQKAVHPDTFKELESAIEKLAAILDQLDEDDYNAL